MNRAVGKLSRHSTFFLLCDVQERFRDVIHKMDHVILTSKMMSSASKVMEVPVIVTEQVPKVFKETCAEIEINTNPLAKVFSKTKFSMITPEVEAHMKTLGKRNSAVIFGIETHVCVLQTTLDLLERGYDVHVVVDGVSSQRVTDRETALKRMELAGAYLTTMESALFMMMEDSEYENFRAISGIVKEYGQSIRQSNSSL